jgi:Flp pilus assembly protein TadB
MHPAERSMLQQIEERLRRENPDLDAFLAGRSALRRPRAVIGAIYLVLPVIVVFGLALDVAALVVAGVIAAPLIPVSAWLLIRRRSR